MINTKSLQLIKTKFWLLSLVVTMAIPMQALATKPSTYRDGEILIRYKTNVSSSAITSHLSRQSFKALGKVFRSRRQKIGDAIRVKLKAGETVESAVARLKRDPLIETVQPNFKYHINSTTPDDTHFDSMWALKNTGQEIDGYETFGPSFADTQDNAGTSGLDMKMTSARDRITDCSSVIVAVIDTGIKYDHEDLVDNMWDGGVSFPNHGYDFANTDDDPIDDHGHGTHVAGTIGAVGNNTLGTVGVCWSVQLMAIKVLEADGSGDTAMVASGITWAVDHGAKVINMSLGGSDDDPVVKTAMEYARDNDVVVVSAAGNDGVNNSTVPNYPCNYKYTNTVCVAALTQKFNLADFSNYSSTYVDVGAPGVNIVSSWPTERTDITDDFSTSWTYATNTATAWGPQTILSKDSLTVPANWNGSVQYANSTTAKAYKTFDMSGYSDAWMYFKTLFNLSSGDYVKPYVITGTADPTAGSVLDSYTGLTGSTRYLAIYDLAPECTSSICTVGFQLTTNGSGTNSGALFADFKLVGFSAGTAGYNVLEGTSMASPHVAGLAALVRAYNPDYTAADTANSLKLGGGSLSSLSGKTTTGRAVDGPGVLAHIQAPTGVSAVQGP